MPQNSIQILIDQIEQVAHETDFSGVVSIFQADSPPYEQAFGYRDVPNQVPNSPATRFGIASGTKLFTALGIGRLIDQGLLTLETQVGELSRDYAGFIAPGATIRHLLTHTSGIYDYFDEKSSKISTISSSQFPGIASKPPRTIGRCSRDRLPSSSRGNVFRTQTAAMSSWGY